MVFWYQVKNENLQLYAFVKEEEKDREVILHDYKHIYTLEQSASYSN